MKIKSEWIEYNITITEDDGSDEREFALRMNPYDGDKECADPEHAARIVYDRIHAGLKKNYIKIENLAREGE